MNPSLFVNCDVRSKEQYGHEIWISSYRARHTVHTQGIQKKARPTLPWVKGSRLAVQNSFPNDLVLPSRLFHRIPHLQLDDFHAKINP